MRTWALGRRADVPMRYLHILLVAELMPVPLGPFSVARPTRSFSVSAFNEFYPKEGLAVLS
jgi:hypothetical protein